MAKIDRKRIERIFDFLRAKRDLFGDRALQEAIDSEQLVSVADRLSELAERQYNPSVHSKADRLDTQLAPWVLQKINNMLVAKL